VSSNKIGVIGAGKIGAAMARGVIRGGLASKENVMASDVSDALRESIVQDLGIKTPKYVDGRPSRGQRPRRELPSPSPWRGVGMRSCGCSYPHEPRKLTSTEGEYP